MGVFVECKKCGYEWMLRPRRWENFSFRDRNGRKCKIIHCPNCMTKNLIGIKKVTELLRRSDRLGKDYRLAIKRA